MRISDWSSDVGSSDLSPHRTMPLAALWGDGTTSSSDGQQLHAGGRGAAIGDINARSGNEPGVAFYTHVSDRYDPFASRVIAATAGEEIGRASCRERGCK